MKILIDNELVDIVTGTDRKVNDVPDQTDWYTDESPVQPCSIDLTVGEIYLPGSKENCLGSKDRPHEHYSLKPGQTVVIRTNEEIEFTGSYSGIVFPASRVAFQGILVTNPGHVDPGYKGHMRFTVINMSREEYILNRGAVIVTMLIFEQTSVPKKHWLIRKIEKAKKLKEKEGKKLTKKEAEKLKKEEKKEKEEANPLTQEHINKLSLDFMDIDERAKKMAAKAIKEEEFKVKFWSALIPIATAVILFLLNLYNPNIISPRIGQELAKLQNQIDGLNKQLSIQTLEQRVDDVEEKLGMKKSTPPDSSAASSNAGVGENPKE